VNTTAPGTPCIAFSIDADARRRVATFTGRIGDRELFDAYASLVNEPDYDPSLDDLIDLRGVTHMGVTGTGLHRLIAMYDQRESDGYRTRAAIVAPTDVLYGVARMFQALRGDDTPEEIEVFRSMDAALRWLTAPAALSD
jgi:hypothetical protein